MKDSISPPNPLYLVVVGYSLLNIRRQIKGYDDYQMQILKKYEREDEFVDSKARITKDK